MINKYVLLTLNFFLISCTTLRPMESSPSADNSLRDVLKLPVELKEKIKNYLFAQNKSVFAQTICFPDGYANYEKWGKVNFLVSRENDELIFYQCERKSSGGGGTLCEKELLFSLVKKYRGLKIKKQHCFNVTKSMKSVFYLNDMYCIANCEWWPGESYSEKRIIRASISFYELNTKEWLHHPPAPIQKICNWQKRLTFEDVLYLLQHEKSLVKNKLTA